MKKVSACIVTYNNSEIIVNTVSSILEATKGVELQLFVVDNASTDGTAELVRSTFNNVTVIDAGGNIGFGAGHNRVLNVLDSDFHAVINPDILLKEDTLTALSEYMSENADVGMLSPRILGADGKEQILAKRNPTVVYLGAHRVFHHGDEPNKIIREYCMLDEEEKGEPFEIQNATGCFMFFRTSVFKELGGFDERFFMYLEDCDIARRAAKISKVLFFPYANVWHIWERGSKKNKKLLLIHVQSILKYFLKWGLKIK